MHSFYNFISGPLLYASLFIAISGVTVKLIQLIVLTFKKERFIFSFLSIKYSFKSLLHWMIPFGSTAMRKSPVFTIISFTFHLCLFATPFFCLSHIVFCHDLLGINFYAFSDTTIDIMTLLVIFSGLFFILRRFFITEVRFISFWTDYVLIILVILPFITGFWAFHQFPGHRAMHIIHILSGEILIVIIPFTRLGHMIYGNLTRIYMSSEFGGVKEARDW